VETLGRGKIEIRREKAKKGLGGLRMDEVGGDPRKKKQGKKKAPNSQTLEGKDPGGNPVKSRGVKNGEDDDDDCRAAAAADHTERWRGGWGEHSKRESKLRLVLRVRRRWQRDSGTRGSEATESRGAFKFRRLSGRLANAAPCINTGIG
jgi:hypothetical protein